MIITRNNEKELNYLIECYQKWIMNQNVNIVKKFCEYVWTEKNEYENDVMS